MSLDMVCPNSSSYEPSSLVTTFHGIPHIDINLNQNVTEFENSLDYYETIIIWSCVPILAALCIFILMSVYFICVCCCCCCQQHEERSKVSKASCGIFVTLLIVLGLACCGVALWAEFSIDNHIRSASDAATDANSAVQNVSMTANSLNFSVLRADVMALGDAVSGSDNSLPGFAEATAAVTLLVAELPNVETAFMEIQNNADVDDFSSTLDTIDLVELARHWTVVAYVILTIVILVVMILSVCCGAICKTPHCMVIALVMFSFYTFIMWIAVGGNLGYLVIGGDICNDPDRIIRMEFVGPVTEDELQYYLVCNETCYPNPFADFESDANAALDTIMTQQGVVRMFANNNGLMDVQEALDAVEGTVDFASSAITGISSLTECTTLNTDYLQVLDDFCQDGYMFSLILFAMACVLAVTFILIICFGSFYAGLFSKGRGYDDETIVYDFPNDEGPSPWQSYGTQQRYHNTQPYTTQESFNMASGQQQPEPPKYTDLHQESHMNGNMHPRMSGNYDS